MAKTYITCEELVRSFWSIQELRELCGMNDTTRWGVIARGFESDVGIYDDTWKEFLPFSLVLHSVEEKCAGIPWRNIILFYGIEIPTGKIIPQLINVSKGGSLEYECSFPTPVSAYS